MIGFAGNSTIGTGSPKAYPIGTRPAKPSIIPAAYEVFKTGLRGVGYYKDIEPYLPDRYIKKYTYKPHKRVAGYLGQAVHPKKKYRTYDKFSKEHCVYFGGSDYNQCRRSSNHY